MPRESICLFESIKAMPIIFVQAQVPFTCSKQKLLLKACFASTAEANKAGKAGVQPEETL